VARVDPATNDVVVVVPVDGDWIRDVVGSPDSVAVLTRNGESFHLTVIDARTNEATTSVDAPIGAYPFAEDGGYLWAASGTSLLKIDAATADVVEEHSIGAHAYGDAIAPGPDGVWLLGDDPNTPSVDELVLFDPETGTVTSSVAAPWDVVAMVASPGTVWVLTYDASVTRVDLGE
jgi:hypothetical protein